MNKAKRNYSCVMKLFHTIIFHAENVTTCYNSLILGDDDVEIYIMKRYGFFCPSVRMSITLYQ